MFAAVHTPSGAELALLARCAADFSPYVEETSPDTVVISVSGLAHLFGSPKEIGEAIARHAAELGLTVQVALAANPDLAVHGAHGLSGVHVIDAAAVADLPIDLLTPTPAIADTLVLWGIRTFGQLAALPLDGVTERLGPDGARLHALACGKGSRPLVPAHPAPRFEEAMELEDPVSLLEPLAFILGRLIGAVCTRLESHGLAAHELTLRLAPDHVRTLRLPYPMRDSRVFLKLLTLDLEQYPPAAPVTGVTLTAEPVNPRVVQHGLFLPPTPEPQKLELTLARIRKLVGPANVGAPQLCDTHRPRAFKTRDSILISGFSAEIIGERGYGPGFCVRVYRPALKASVQATNGWPVRVAARGVRGRVLDLAGPWRTSGDWWREDAWSRDEWDVELSDGTLYLLSRDRRDGEWYIEGAYD